MKGWKICLCALTLSTSLGAREKGTLRLILLGDLQVHQRRADPLTALAGLRTELRRADLVYANLEGVLVASQGSQDIPDKQGWTHPGPKGVSALLDAGVDAVGLANNVAYGQANILHTIQLLDQAKIAHVGAGRDLEEAHRPAILKRHGVRVGFLQYTARWYRADQQLAGPHQPGVAALHSRDGLQVEPADLALVRRDIGRLRPQVDVLIVSQHNRDGATAVQYGPRERRRNLRWPEAYQRQFAHAALEAGADLVYGHGTHCLQGIEIYRGRAILYAVGHSAFDQPGHEKDREGLAVQVQADGHGVAGVSLLTLSRDGHNDVFILDPARGAGAETVKRLRALSPGVRLELRHGRLRLTGLAR